MKSENQIAEECGCDQFESFPKCGRNINICSIIENLDLMYRRYGKKVVLYGGQLATPWFYGFKKMRAATNDVDLMIASDTIERVVRDYNPRYSPRYRIFLAVLDSVPYVFSCGHIHDWTVPDDFFLSAVLHNFGSHSVTVCSREYLIALKLRRGVFSDHSLFGKDAIDILNIITAPFIRKELNQIDLSHCAELFLQNTDEHERDVVKSLMKYIPNLPLEYRRVCEDQVLFLQRQITGENK